MIVSHLKPFYKMTLISILEIRLKIIFCTKKEKCSLIGFNFYSTLGRVI